MKFKIIKYTQKRRDFIESLSVYFKIDHLFNDDDQPENDHGKDA